MEIFKSFPLFCLLAAMCQFVTLSAHDPIEKSLQPKCGGRDCHCCVLRCQLGTSSFSVMDPLFWYTIDASAFPNTVPLSMNQNYGSTQGDVELTPTGLQLGAPGNYSVSFSAIVQNPDPESVPLLSVFLVKNDLFDPLDVSVVSSMVSIPSGLACVVQGTGIVENVRPGTTLSLVAANGTSLDSQPITVISWNISAFKIQCDIPYVRPQSNS